MDPRSLLIAAALFMLLNGGVLGLMHRSLSPDVRPAAVAWRIGTLLMAGGSILLAVQDMLPGEFIFPVANGIYLLGAALYWRSMRRLAGLPSHPLTWVPAILAIAGVYWASAIVPTHIGRVFFACAGLAVYFFAAAWTLHYRYNSGAQPAVEVSRAVLTGIFVIVGGFVTFRGVYFLFLTGPTPDLLTSGAWITLSTTLLVTSLPVIGTTAFLVMCSERLRRQWEHAAATDYLTSLPNRRSIIGTGEARFNTARRNGAQFAVAVIDIDHFKSINDRFGHEVGDLALKHIAALLEHHCRGPHMVGRQGGEEFVALFEDANAEAALAVAERVRAAIESAPMQHKDESMIITVSIGVGVIAPTDRNFDVVLRRADHALYAAKSGGRNRVEMAASPLLHLEEPA